MKLIIICGPSGSGKTTLSKLILKKFKNGIILNTDNYYKTGIESKILSKLIDSYFDRKISFNIKLFKKDLKFIIDNGFSNFSYKYDFKRKSKNLILKKIKNINLIIVEGIFATEVLKTLSKKINLFIQLNTSKKICMNRVIERDIFERGKKRSLARKDFKKAWELYYKNEILIDNKNYLEKILITNKTNLNMVLEKIINI